MSTRVEIDPNVRVRGQLTYAGFEDVTGPLSVGQTVEVFESESGLVGEGRVVEIDTATQLVYLGVNWGSLTIRDSEQPESRFAAESWLVHDEYVPDYLWWLPVPTTTCLSLSFGIGQVIDRDETVTTIWPQGESSEDDRVLVTSR